MNTTHRPARIAAVLLIALVSWAIAAPLAVAAATSGGHTAKARTPQVRWYRWHPTAHRFHKHYGSKVVIGVSSMLAFKELRVEYGFDVGTAHELPALRAVLAKVDAAQLHTLLTRGTRDPRIRYVSPIRENRDTQSVPNDPYVSTVDGTTKMPYEWAFLATHVDRALDFTKGDSHVVVGVIDSGVAQIPDLARKIDSRWNVSGGQITQVFDDNDDLGHGTGVASLIAANADDGLGLAGFGGDAHIIGVHAGIAGYFYDLDVAIALTKLVSLGVRIVNMSIGGKDPSEPMLVDAIHSAAAQNVLLVASAGNNNTDVFWPAAEFQRDGGVRSYGLAVGATDGNGDRASFSSWGSNWGRHLSIMAPGTYSAYTGVVAALPLASPYQELFPTWADERNAQYAYLGGTSFASPEVAGVAALVWAANPELKNYQVADILKQSASRTAPDWTPEMGCGTLDAGAALELATSRPASAFAETPNASGAACTAFGDAPVAWSTEKAQSIVFGPIATKHLGDRDFKVQAYASSGLPLSITAYGSCTLKGVKIHLVRTGWCTVIAEQFGNDEYHAAANVSQKFLVAKALHKNHHV